MLKMVRISFISRWNVRKEMSLGESSNSNSCFRNSFISKNVATLELRNFLMISKYLIMKSLLDIDKIFFYSSCIKPHTFRCSVFKTLFIKIINVSNRHSILNFNILANFGRQCLCFQWVKFLKLVPGQQSALP